MSIETVNEQSVQFVHEGVEGGSAGPKTFVEATDLARQYASYKPTDEQLKLVAKMDAFVSREENFIFKYPNANLYKVIDQCQDKFVLWYRYSRENEVSNNTTDFRMSVGEESKLDLKVRRGVLKLESKAAS